MEKFSHWEPEESFRRFERAAARGHEESIWIVSVVKDVEMKKDAWRKAFVKTETPLGWYFAGKLSELFSRKQFDYFKKSAEGGCSWGQVSYGFYLKDGLYVEADDKVYVEWLEKAAQQNNPRAMEELGQEEERGDNKEQAVSYFCRAAELGWRSSLKPLMEMLRKREECEKDSRQAVIWSAQADSYMFWYMLKDVARASDEGTTEDLDCDFNQLCYLLGWGLFWYKYESRVRKGRRHEEKLFGPLCLDLYGSCVELQQESIFTFLLFWNREMGVKDVGVMMGKMVWEGREENLVKSFER
jgi:TPR repeat protein